MRHIIPLVLLLCAASPRASAQELRDTVASMHTFDVQWDSTGMHIITAFEPVPQVYQTGLATYYSSRTHGRLMADGTRYDKNELFCAHRTLPFGTMVRVVNKKNGREVTVRVRDRGPFAKGRIIDLSNRAAAEIGMISDGVTKVDLYIVEE